MPIWVLNMTQKVIDIIAMCAIDNLMKGASGTAVQCMNLMSDWDEAEGLKFAGLHPI